MEKVKVTQGKTEEYKTIPLTQGKECKVDKEDYHELNKYFWTYNNGYVMRSQKAGKNKFKTIRMHRQIMGFPNGKFIDHINHDTLDNRKSNLRICTNKQNVWNSRKPSTNKSGYKGVCFHKASGKWSAEIRGNGKKRYLGLFKDPKEAAFAYDNAAREEYGEFAYLNFSESRLDVKTNE